MMCRNCGRIIEPCLLAATCGIGYVHSSTHEHYCDDPPVHGVDPPRFAEADPTQAVT